MKTTGGNPQLSAAELEGIEEGRRLKKHLKGLSKNQLIFQIFQMANAMQEQIAINRYLHEQLKQNNNVKENKDESSSTSSSNSNSNGN